MALILAIAFAVIYKYGHHKPDPVPVVAPVVVPAKPEQLHHVIYLFVCDKLEGVLVVGDHRPMWANDHEAASTRMLELMLDAEKSANATQMRHRHRDCPEERV